jgi:hypothetical protein
MTQTDCCIRLYSDRIAVPKRGTQRCTPTGFYHIRRRTANFEYLDPESPDLAHEIISTTITVIL